LCGREFFGELVHRRVRLQIRVRFGEREHAAQGSPEGSLGSRQFPHGCRVAGGRGRALRGGARLVARDDDRLQRLALVLEVALGRLDQVGDQVVPPLELHIDLRESVLVAVAQLDQPVVSGHRQQSNEDQDTEDDPSDHAIPPALQSRRTALRTVSAPAARVQILRRTHPRRKCTCLRHLQTLTARAMTRSSALSPAGGLMLPSDLLKSFFTLFVLAPAAAAFLAFNGPPAVRQIARWLLLSAW